jgi:hypothetical protein
MRVWAHPLSFSGKCTAFSTVTRADSSEKETTVEVTIQP